MDQGNPISILNERTMKDGMDPPKYETERIGPEHRPIFICNVVIAGITYGIGRGNKLKEAKQRAARDALDTINLGFDIL
jgi:dsRNA-specific ribonuclease